MIGIIDRLVQCVGVGRRIVFDPHTYAIDGDEVVMMTVWPARCGTESRRMICHLSVKKSDLRRMIDNTHPI